MKRHLSILLITLFCSINIIAQSLDSLFIKVQRMQELRLQNIFSEKRDSIFNLFESSIQKLFFSQEFCDTTLDSSFFYINPKTSDDGIYLAYSFINNLVNCSNDQKIRIFSWDDLGGGSYHTYTNYLQYRIDNGKCKIIPFDTLQDNLEVGYYKIETLNIENRNIYIFFGYGTCGGGQHHKNIRFFEIVNNEPKECFDLYPNGKDIVIFSNRSQNPDIKFDKQRGLITYKQFVFNEDMEFYENEFELKTIRLFDKR